jgi:hypothetical protein
VDIEPPGDIIVLDIMDIMVIEDITMEEDIEEDLD